MTLPTNINLPDSDDPYLRRLTYALSTYMQQTNFEGNGTYTSLTNADSYQFIQGTSSSGTATYSTTTMFVNRSNLVNRIWFDITWANHTGTGNTLVTVPYDSQFVSNHPFVCVIEPSGMAFTAGYTYLVGNLTPNTNTIEIRQCGSGVPSIALPLPAAGTLRGSIVYAGQQFS